MTGNDRIDVEKIREDTQMIQEPLWPGYKPVLRVEIPCSYEKQTDGKQLLARPILPDDPNEAQESIDFKRFGPDGQNSEYFIDAEEFDSDRHLQLMLAKQLGESQLPLPGMSQGGRMIMDPNSGIFTEHEFIESLPGPKQLLGDLLHRFISTYHEIGNQEAVGGHFTSVIHPETATHSQMLVWGDILGYLYAENNYPRAFPLDYYEVTAILEERKALEQLSGHDSPFSYLLEEVQTHPAEVEALKQLDSDRLNEMVWELSETWEEKFTNIEPGKASYPDYIADIVRYLEDTLPDGKEQALKLLDVPRKIGMHADKWLCNVIHDLESSTLEPEQIPAHSSYWDTRRSPDRVNHDYDELVKKYQTSKEEILEDPKRRAAYSTHEIVTLTEDSLVRTWYSYKPTVEYDLERIRSVLFLQELFYNFHRNSRIRVLNNSRKSAQYDGPDGSVTFYQSGYQKAGIDEPFSEAIEGNTTSKKIGRYYDYDDSNQQEGLNWWKWGRDQATENLLFNKYTEVEKWLQHGRSVI